LPKKITADLDSEDEIILNMKGEGYGDVQIAEHLSKQNRVQYDHKTIATRFIRIKRAISARQDERLEEGLTDWHEGEVC